MHTLNVTTHTREELLDITGMVRELVRDQSWADGALLLYCPHTTGAVTVKMGDKQYPEQNLLR